MTNPNPTPRPVAVWRLKHRWTVAILCALVPVIFTSVGYAAGQILVVDDTEAVWVIAAAATVSALLGLLVAGLSRQRLRAFAPSGIVRQ